jgi:hypothetical protein
VAGAALICLLAMYYVPLPRGLVVASESVFLFLFVLVVLNALVVVVVVVVTAVVLG